MNNTHPNLYKILLQWRDNQAKEENIPESQNYFIFPNSTLKNIAEMCPQSINELKKIKGIDKKKLAQYGKKVITLIQQNCTNTNKKLELFETAILTEKPKIPIVEPDQEVLTVSQLNNRIKNILSQHFENGIWVCGEVYRYELDLLKANSRPYRQIYFELVEQDPITKERKASIPAMIWGDNRDRIEQKMITTTSGLTLKDGLQIKAKCFVDFYTPQGKVQLQITDIEPEYTVGKMAIEKKLLIEKLRKIGFLEKNKQLEIPALPLNIGLITSFESAAYNDFIDELKSSGYGFKVFLCDARMQGADLERDVNAAISTLNKYPVDVIAVVRGGGSASDLMGFDKEGVAVAIANSKKPVLTGIGHQIDKTVSDEVANRSFKTPTATAQFIVELVRGFELDVEDIFLNILENQKQILTNENEKLKNITKEVKSTTIMFVKDLYNNIAQIKEKIKWILKKLFDDNFRKLDELERLNNSKNPVNILKLGFGLVYTADGKIVKSVEKVSIGSNVKIELSDGNLGGQIISKEKKTYG